MSSQKKVVLAKPADWDDWISLIRSRAINNDIWHLVNPELPEKPQTLPEQEVPSFILPPAGQPIDRDALELYKIQNSLYKTQLGKYECQKKAFGDLISFIQETTSAQNITLIQKVEPYPWDLLRALKNRLAPSDEARSLEVEQSYHKLCKGPRSQDLETWLDEWVTTYTKAKELGIFEVSGTRPIRDFLMAARHRETSFADVQMARLDENRSNNLFDLIEKFRQHLRLQRLQQPASTKNTHSAFSAHSSPSFRGKQVSRPPKPCLCGDTHWLADCYYLIPEKRPKGWEPNADKQKLVDDALKDSRTKAWAERTLEKRKSWDKDWKQDNLSQATLSSTPVAELHASSPQPGPSNQVSMGNSGAFICVQASSSAATWTIQNSWLLDNGTNIHVCNSTMLSRFTKTRSSGPKDILRAGNQVLPIECYGTIDIFINTPIGCQTITLLNVAYVSDFMTNLVSMNILTSKGVYFNSKEMHLYRDTGTMAYVENHDGFHLMENNTGTQVKSASAGVDISRSGSTQDCHHPLEDPSDNPIKPCEDSPKEVDNISTLNLDSNLDLDADLDLDAINKIEEIGPVDTEVKSDKEEDLYPPTPDDEHLTESASLSQISTHSESASGADEISTVLDVPINLPEGVETQQTPNASEAYYAASDTTYLTNIFHAASDELPESEYLIDLPQSHIPVNTESHARTANEKEGLPPSTFQTITSSSANAALTAAKPLNSHQDLPSHLDKIRPPKVRDGANLGVG